ncbi:CRISPR system precrRNA processing endoribonuclease RAMP protein Cas6 [Paenibacillus polysaccharolyticus]|uniref:CRISPR system precrRNA processing endoribonuclease RAMP protein Cas6 n=1 Tax=Paenibacillus polysaccharolyticus TaxID=582692 RepID=UPI0020A1A15C|nr:CRISPR system precrRNA processing endoribonuclease RAMP protein Cas6 [Paenibacillus polysaccharolyticus]MCP1137378.1 CRISPR system precrRNA processing endoribonuclease RAMP protein Cas6 [Paenibacillus polysaccharolyticus]
MNKQTIFSLEYLPLLIRLKAKETARLPAFLGSTLHGVVGWTLAQHSPESYAYVFENRRLGGATQDIVNPYIIEPPRPKSVYFAGDSLCFRLILLGDAVRYAQHIVSAFVQVHQFGIGAERKPFELIDILQGNQYGSIWQGGKMDIEAATLENISAFAQQDQAFWCSTQFLTPVRIRRGGALVQEINVPTIIRSITRRVQTLTERYGGHINEATSIQACELASEIQLGSSALFLNQMHRYSSRKKDSVDWSGMLGALNFEGELTPLTPWLNAARILHIGRNSTFGCGQIEAIYR